MTEVPAPDFSRSRAVLIGTSKYSELTSIPAAANSLRRMYKLLTGPLCGWPASRVEQISNRRVPGNLPDKLVDLFAGASDVALFYYVGHGQPDLRDRLCLGLVESRRQAERRVTTSLTFDAVRHALDASQAKTKIVILDCCFAGLALSGEGTLGSVDVMEVTRGTGAYTVAASGEYNTAWFETDPNITSPHTYFTKGLAEIVEHGVVGAPAVLTLDLVVEHLTEDLARDGKPTPTHRARDYAGKFPFARNVAAVPAAPAVPNVPNVPRKPAAAPQPVLWSEAEDPNLAASSAYRDISLALTQRAIGAVGADQRGTITVAEQPDPSPPAGAHVPTNTREPVSRRRTYILGSALVAIGCIIAALPGSEDPDASQHLSTSQYPNASRHPSTSQRLAAVPAASSNPTSPYTASSTPAPIVLSGTSALANGPTSGTTTSATGINVPVPTTSKSTTAKNAVKPTPPGSSTTASSPLQTTVSQSAPVKSRIRSMTIMSLAPNQKGSYDYVALIRVETDGVGAVALTVTFAGSNTSETPGNNGAQSETVPLSGKTTYDIQEDFDTHGMCPSPYIDARVAADGAAPADAYASSPC